MKASVFTSKFDNRPDVFDCTWDDLVGLWRDASEQSRKIAEKDGDATTRACTPAICPAEYEPGDLRRKVNVRRWWFFAADVDNEDPDAMLTKDDAVAILQSWGLGYVVHSSTKSREHQHRYRLIFKLSRPIEMAEYEQVWASINQKFAGIFDHKTRDPSRLFFVPARWEGSYWFFETQDGAGLDVDQVVRDYPVQVQCNEPPPIPEADVARVTEQMAAVRAKLLGARDLTDITDPFGSPFVSERMRTDYMTAGAGGRFYKFMGMAAMNALRKGYAISATELETLALAFDRGVTGKSRTNSLREAQRALKWAAEHVAADTHIGVTPIMKPENSTLKDWTK